MVDIQSNVHCLLGVEGKPGQVQRVADTILAAQFGVHFEENVVDVSFAELVDFD